MDDPSIHNEKELLQQIAEGDEKAFAQLFDQYRKKVFGVALMLTSEESIAEEMVQEVFMKVWAGRVNLINVLDFNAWLFIITRNTAYRTLQKIAYAQKSVRDAGYTQPLFSSETEDNIIYKDYLKIFQEAVNQLPPQQKAVWLLAKEEGLSRSEIAQKMQIKPDTVKEYLSLASKSVRLYCLRHTGLSAYLIFIWLFQK